MKKTILCMTVLAFLVTFLPGVTYAAGRGHGFQQVEAYRLLFSADQNKKLDALLAPAKQEFPPLVQELRGERQKLHALLKDEAAKDSDIKAEIDKMAGIQYQMALQRAAIIRGIRKIATPEQVAKVDALEAKQLKQREKFIDAMKNLYSQDQEN